MNTENYRPSTNPPIELSSRSTTKNRATNAYKKFNILFLSLVFIGLFLFAGFNFFIDPYGIYNSPQIASINKYKSEQASYDRIFQAVEVIRRKPNVIFIGSSTVQFGLDTRFFPEKPSDKVYNVGLQNGSIHEINRYFKHALVNNPEIKNVVMGLDLFTFEKDKENNPNYDENRLERKSMILSDISKTLFSFSAYNASRETIKNNLNGTASNFQYINGMLLYDPKTPVPGSLDKFIFFLKGIFKKDPNIHRFSAEKIAYFEEIVNICQQKNINLQVFFSPSHATQWTGTSAVGDWYWQEWENWKRELVKITPIWDFSGYNSVTTEPVSEEMKYYYDSAHYRPSVSKLILARMFNQSAKIPEDFGVLLTPENIEDNLQKIRQAKERRKRTHPEEMKIINQVKK